MGWICQNCNSYNDDVNTTCFVCDSNKPAEKPICSSPKSSITTTDLTKKTKGIKWSPDGIMSIVYGAIGLLCVVFAIIFGVDFLKTQSQLSIRIFECATSLFIAMAMFLIVALICYLIWKDTENMHIHAILAAILPPIAFVLAFFGVFGYYFACGLSLGCLITAFLVQVLDENLFILPIYYEYSYSSYVFEVNVASGVVNIIITLLSLAAIILSELNVFTFTFANLF
ncbi:MAG: hypothetical protein IJW13_04780 [Clostridia bacterium]|nr:hypothetical protein [Clostridia bacterium]